MRKIIIDCDPGIDDAMAIFLALVSRNDVEVLGLTCVKGNVALDKTYLNAQRICAAAGRLDIPVLRGIARPILAPGGLAASVHGEDGLGDIDLPAPEGLPETGMNAVDFILKMAEEYPGEITLVLSRIRAAPIARLGHLAFEGQGAFASQCRAPLVSKCAARPRRN